jgi:branched-chain amino acid aminotransferase
VPTPLAYFNGRFLPAAEVALPLHDAGVVWGAIVADRLRTFGGRLFAIDAHLRRFRHSCELAHVPQPVPDARLARVTEHLVKENRHEGEISAIWVATPGPIPGIAPPSVAHSPTLIAYTQPLDIQLIERLATIGASLVPVAATTGVDARIKHRSRLSWWQAALQVHATDADSEPLFVDPTTNEVLETPSANVLAVIDGVVTSPPRDRILNGISLGVVEDLCKHLSVPFVERSLSLADLKSASEVMLANTSFCLVGVSRIGDQSIPLPGPVLMRLLDGWSQWVGVEIRPQKAAPS